MPGGHKDVYRARLTLFRRERGRGIGLAKFDGARYTHTLLTLNDGNFDRMRSPAVPRISIGPLSLTTCCWVCLWTSLMRAAPPMPPMESMLPSITKSFVSIPDSKNLDDLWGQTDLGKTLRDPVMQPFSTDLRRQMQGRWSKFINSLGINLDDLRGVPSGEMSVAKILLSPQKFSSALLIDITGHQPQATQLLQKVKANQLKAGARPAQTAVAGVPVLAFTQPDKRVMLYVQTAMLFVACDDAGVLQFILTHAAGEPGGTLAEVTGFQYVMARAKKDAGDVPPQIRWFVEPLGYMQISQLENPERKPTRGKTRIEIFKNQGLDGFQAAGGFIHVNLDAFQALHRTAVYAPKPFQKSMKLFVLPNRDASQFAPEPFVPRDVATYSVIYFDLLNGFDNFGPLYDELYGEKGETGLWQDVLKGMLTDTDGPQIDLRQELFVFLGDRISVLSDYKLPITTSSERLLFAIPAKDPKAVAKALEKLNHNKSNRGVKRHEYRGAIIWETVPRPKKPRAKSTRGKAPLLKPNTDEDEESEEKEKLLPYGTSTVAFGHLLIASHYDFLLKVLAPRNPANTLAQDVDYRIVDEVTRKLYPGPYSVRTFTHSDQEYRATYELIQQGKMPESETVLGRLLNRWFNPQRSKTPRKPEINGSKMPDYEFVRRSLAPGGTFGVTEENGWFFKGFMLGKSEK